MKKILVCGLGNIDKSLYKTRHNIGFIIIDNLLDFFFKKQNKKINNYLFECNNNKFNNLIFFLLKPYLGINLSGKVLNDICKSYSFDDILIIYDDATMDFLKHRFKIKKSKETHNGIRNINNFTFNRQLIRLKIGVGNYVFFNKDIDEFVMSNFTNSELFFIKKFCKSFFLSIFNFYNKNNICYDLLKKFNGTFDTAM